MLANRVTYQELLRKRHALEEQLNTLQTDVIISRRCVPTDEDKKQQTVLETKISELNARIEEREPTNTMNFFAPGSDHNPEVSRNIDVPRFPGVAQFINRGEGGIQASLTEGGTLQYTVPGYEVQSFLNAYPATSPFEQAGSTIFATEDGRTLKVPIVAAGAAPSTYAEGSGPNSAQDAGVYVASLEATKYAFLTKISEEAAQDIQGLETTLAGEGVRRVLNKVSAAATAALVTSLDNADATVDAGSDHLQSLIDLEAAIDPTWGSPNNVFMMSRSSLSQVRNVRDLQDRPIFDTAARTLLGYRVVINDSLHGKVVFGAFGPGVYIRHTPIIVQRLVELYSESGLLGIRFQRRADWAFFSDAANATQAPQPLFMLNTDVGS